MLGIFERKLRVVRNDQIQEVVAIVVEPGCTSSPLPAFFTPALSVTSVKVPS